jgi:isoleucyl-tRNA synthetase
MLNSPAVRGEDLRFNEKGVEQVLRQALIPLWHSFGFLSTNAKIYQWEPHLIEKKPAALIDRWILSMTQKLVKDVEGALDVYHLSLAVEPLVGFIEQLTNWYIRRCRSRFWSDQDTEDRREAFSTLYTVIMTLVKTAAPFIPFCTDEIYRELRSEKMPESVHLCDYPIYQSDLRDLELESEVEAVQKAVSLGHSLRKEYKLKVRQPLAKAHLITSNAQLLKALEKQKQLISDELNVKDIEYHSEEGAFVQWFTKPNFPVLGKKIGKLMPQAQKLIQAFDRTQVQALHEGKSVSIEIAGEKIEISSEDVYIERKVKEGLAAGVEGDLTVARDTDLNGDLMLEGLAREIVNKINTMRRDLGFEVTDRIHVSFDTTPRVEEAFRLHGDTIRGEVLALDVQFGTASGEACDLNGEKAVIAIQRVQN